MQYNEFLSILSVAEKLKCNTRHSDTSSGRRESVAEHSWRLALMAMLLADEFPNTDINKVIQMCLIHDLGEAFTGDIATFDKTDADSVKEDMVYADWVETFPEVQKKQFQDLLAEMNALQTKEAKLYKALDICTVTEKKYVVTGRDTGVTSAEFADYVMETIAKM